MTDPRTILSAVVLLAVTATAAVAGDAPAAWQGEEVTVDGVVHVKNPAVAMEPARSVTLREVWRVGEESGDVVIGAVGGFLRDGEGNSYLLDAQLSQIHVVGPGGEYLRTIGRSGEGPAEFDAASGMTMLSDSVLCVSQVMPPRLVQISLDGRAAGDHPLSRDLVTAMINGCAAVDGSLVLFLGQLVERETSVGFRSFVAGVDAAGNVGTTYWEMFQEADFANITFDEAADAPPVWAVGRKGEVYVSSEWDAYAITAVSPSDATRRVIERAYQPIPRPKWQMELVDVRIDKQEMPPSTTIADAGRTIVDVFPKDDGTLWVLTDRGANDAPEGAMATFDVFDHSGYFVRQVTVSGDYVPGRDELYMRGDFVAVVINGGPMGGSAIFESVSADIPEGLEVRCYEVDHVD